MVSVTYFEKQAAILRDSCLCYLLDEMLLRWLRSYNELRGHELDIARIESVQREWVDISYLVQLSLREWHTRAVAPDLSKPDGP